MRFLFCSARVNKGSRLFFSAFPSGFTNELLVLQMSFFIFYLFSALVPSSRTDPPPHIHPADAAFDAADAAAALARASAAATAAASSEEAPPADPALPPPPPEEGKSLTRSASAHAASPTAGPRPARAARRLCGRLPTAAAARARVAALAEEAYPFSKLDLHVALSTDRTASGVLHGSGSGRTSSQRSPWTALRRSATAGASEETTAPSSAAARERGSNEEEEEAAVAVAVVAAVAPCLPDPAAAGGR